MRIVSGDTAPSLHYREAVEHAPASEYPERKDSAIAMLAYVARRMRFSTDEDKWGRCLSEEDAAGARSDLYDFCEKTCSRYSRCHADPCEVDVILEQFNETTTSLIKLSSSDLARLAPTGDGASCTALSFLMRELAREEGKGALTEALIRERHTGGGDHDECGGGGDGVGREDGWDDDGDEAREDNRTQQVGHATERRLRFRSDGGEESDDDTRLPSLARTARPGDMFDDQSSPRRGDDDKKDEESCDGPERVGRGTGIRRGGGCEGATA